MLSLIAFYIIIFFFGAALASFAGVVIERGKGGFDFERLPEILGGRSYCPGCLPSPPAPLPKGEGSKSAIKVEDMKKAQLEARQLIPIFGWLAQGGKCFRCTKRIPGWYQVVELVVGLLFVCVTGLIVGTNPGQLLLDGGTSTQYLIFWLMITWAGAAIVLADILWYELNVRLWLFLMIWIPARGLAGLFSLKMGVFWMLVLVGIYVAIYQFGRRYVKKVFGQDGEGFGQGDVMLAAVIGLLFPFLMGGLDRVGQVQMVMLYLIISSFVGMIFWYIRFLITKDKNNMMPFLPAMIAGFVVLLTRGKELVGMLTY